VPFVPSLSKHEPTPVRAEPVEARTRAFMFWVHIVHCADGSYYTGHTEDLEHRIAMHQLGEVPGYTSSRRPVALAFAQPFPTREEALAAEMQVKGWSRSKKEAMMRDDWPAVSALAHGKRG
jgi:predicted GIY-YIG superfamily endonuclease